MTLESRVPAPARWLLRLSRVPREMRAEVEADLRELFDGRRHDRGVLHAHWRLYHDVASLWMRRWPVAHSATPRARFGIVPDAYGDLRYAVRLFVRQPAILVLTTAGLSIGLGIATSAFSIMNAAILRGEGVVDPDRAPGILRATDRFLSSAWQYDEFIQLRSGSTRMQVEALRVDGAAVRAVDSGGDGPVTSIAFVSGGFFGATGGRVTRGRPLVDADDRDVNRSGPPPVVVSYVFWTARLNQDPAVVGRTIRIGRTAATVVGVAQRGFSAPTNTLLWMPLAAYRPVFSSNPAGAVEGPVQVFGRLFPGVSPVEAEAQLSGVAATLPRGAAGGESSVRVRLDSHVGLGRVPSSNVLGIAAFVFAVIGLVLLLACANAAAVLVASAITREREIGIRCAVGASRSRIVRQLVTESVALGAIAALVGLGLSYWAIPVIGRMIEAPAGADLDPDLTVYLFVAIVTLVSGVAAGLAPAWHGRGADLLTPLKGDGARQDRLAPRRLRSLLVVTQAAVSVLLIVLASLFARATFRAANVDVGFDPRGLYGISAALGKVDRDGAAIRDFWARAVPEVRSLPGVLEAGLAELTPFGDAYRSSITREQPARTIYLNRTRAEYFKTLGLRVLTGRIYTQDEIAAGAPVAVVSQSLAKAYWPNESPIGRTLPSQIPLATTARPVIVGVVADAITMRLHERSAFAIYEPLDPGSEQFGRLIVRVAPGTTGVVEQVRQRLQSVDAQADIRIASVEANLQLEASRPRMLAALTGSVGIIAIALCVIGLYGLTASVVGQRTREMGVRIAMGAQPADLLQLLMWDSLRPVVIGLALGAGAALLASRVVVATMFFGVSPHDPIAFGGAALVLLAAATLAVMLPTRRAASTDAASVLRRS